MAFTMNDPEFSHEFVNPFLYFMKAANDSE